MQSRCEGLKWGFYSSFDWLTSCVGEVGSPPQHLGFATVSQEVILYVSDVYDYFSHVIRRVIDQMSEPAIEDPSAAEFCTQWILTTSSNPHRVVYFGVKWYVIGGQTDGSRLPNKHH